MDQNVQFNVYATDTPSSSSKKSNTGAIAGGVVGGVVALAIIGALIFFFMRKKKRNQNKVDGDVGASPLAPMGHEKNGGTSSSQIGGQSRMLLI